MPPASPYNTHVHVRLYVQPNNVLPPLRLIIAYGNGQKQRNNEINLFSRRFSGLDLVKLHNVLFSARPFVSRAECGMGV